MYSILTYNPFEKSIGDQLTSEDLQILITNNISEGYFVEYKETFTSNNKIGHSIASFANMYGGWYIIGVKTDSQNVAIEINGIDLESCPDPISKIRDIVKSHINPTPIFFLQVIKLDTGRVTVVVYIPPDQDTPFITSDGKIYRRLSDSSDPVSEKDRYALDRLVDQGKKLHEKVESFCKDERVFSKAQEDQPWLSIFLSPYPDIIDKTPSFIDDELGRLEELIQKSCIPLSVIDVKDSDGESNNSGEIKWNLEFNTGQITRNSMILRQVKPEDVAYNSLTIELFNIGWAKIHIPLPILSSLEIKSKILTEVLVKYPSDKIELLKFIDIGKLWLVVSYLMTYYYEWLGSTASLVNVYANLNLSNVWRCVPIVDSDEFATYIDKYGLPIIQIDEIKAPSKLGSGFPLPHDDHTLAWVFLVRAVINPTFGLPGNLMEHIIKEAIVKASKTAG